MGRYILRRLLLVPLLMLVAMITFALVHLSYRAARGTTCG